MKIFLITMFVLYVIRFFHLAAKLAAGDYPQIKEEYADMDVARLMISIGIGGWAAVLLFL